MAERSLFTSESVTMGHPDKISDQWGGFQNSVRAALGKIVAVPDCLDDAADTVG